MSGHIPYIEGLRTAIHATKSIGAKKIIRDGIVEGLSQIPKCEIIEIAMYYGIPGYKAMSAQRLRTAIVEHVAGAHIRSCVIQGEACGWTE